MEATLHDGNKGGLLVPPSSCPGKAQGIQESPNTTSINPPCSLVAFRGSGVTPLPLFWTMVFIVYARTGSVRTLLSKHQGKQLLLNQILNLEKQNSDGPPPPLLEIQNEAAQGEEKSSMVLYQPIVAEATRCQQVFTQAKVSRCDTGDSIHP